MFNFEQYLNLAKKYLIIYAPSLLLTLVTLVVGLKLIQIFCSYLQKYMDKRSIDPSLKFIVSLTNILLKIVLFISVADMLGIKTTSFLAILGAAGLAVGLALQGSLANFAGTVIILIFKPFRVGDTVEVAGHLGVVKEIQVFCTILKTLDSRSVIIPNSSVATGTIVNLSTEELKRIDLTFGIGYGDNIKLAKETLEGLIKAEPRILAEPAPVVAVSELAESTVNFVFRPWVKTEDYWDVYYSMVEKVKLTFDEKGISIPYPQKDIHLYQVNK